MAEATVTIGELASRFELAGHVLRHWEDMGLLTPERDSAGRRRYRETDADTVAMILLGKNVGLSLEVIRALFTSADNGAARRELLRAQRDRLERRLVETQVAVETLTHALECRADDFRTCPDFRAKVDAATRLRHPE